MLSTKFISTVPRGSDDLVLTLAAFVNSSERSDKVTTLLGRVDVCEWHGAYCGENGGTAEIVIKAENRSLAKTLILTL